MQQEGGNPLQLFMMPILILFIFYFILFRPEQKRKKQMQEMIKALKKGDRVVTSGGIIGTIHTMQDDYVVLKTGDSDTNKIEILRAHIIEVRK